MGPAWGRSPGGADLQLGSSRSRSTHLYVCYRAAAAAPGLEGSVSPGSAGMSWFLEHPSQYPSSEPLAGRAGSSSIPHPARSQPPAQGCWCRGDMQGSAPFPPPGWLLFRAPRPWACCQWLWVVPRGAKPAAQQHSTGWEVLFCFPMPQGEDGRVTGGPSSRLSL